MFPEENDIIIGKQTKEFHVIKSTHLKRLEIVSLESSILYFMLAWLLASNYYIAGL